MSNSKSVHVIVATFHSEQAARAAFEELRGQEHLRLIHMEDSAVISKDISGKIHIKETHDMGGGEGAGIGVLVGGAIGLLSGGVGLLGAGTVGAIVGGLAAKLHDGGFKDAKLKEIGESLPLGASALIAVVEEDELAVVHGNLAEDAHQVMVTHLSPAITAQLVEPDLKTETVDGESPGESAEEGS